MFHIFNHERHSSQKNRKFWCGTKLPELRSGVLMVITLLCDKDYKIGSVWKWIYLALIPLIYICLQPFPIIHNQPLDSSTLIPQHSIIVHSSLLKWGNPGGRSRLHCGLSSKCWAQQCINYCGSWEFMFQMPSKWITLQYSGGPHIPKSAVSHSKICNPHILKSAVLTF